MTKRKLQYEKTRSLIWEKGKALISEKGFDTVTIADIAAACEISTGNFYHYFKSKDAFFAALEQQPYNDLLEEIKNLDDLCLSKKLTYYITKRFEYLQENSVEFTRQWIKHASTPAYRELYKEDKISSDINHISELIKQAIDNGELIPETPTSILAHMIVLTLFGTTFYYSVKDGDFNLKQWGKDLSELLEASVLNTYLSKNI